MNASEPHPLDIHEGSPLKSSEPPTRLASTAQPTEEEILEGGPNSELQSAPSPLATQPDRNSDQTSWKTTHREELRKIDTVGSGGGKKRTSSGISPQLSTASGPPPPKRLHHPHHSPRRRLDSSAPSARSPGRQSNDHSKEGPLFFSDHGPRRPVLPYRMSSSDAAARMLGKGNKEDASVKTLKLARGSVSVTSPSRPAGQRTPSGSGRSHFGIPRVRTPDERLRSNTLASLTHAGVVELLEQDDRPTFVLDLMDDELFEPGPLKLVFANASLRAVPAVLDMITGTMNLESPGLSMSNVFSAFKAWTTSYVKNHEPQNVVLPTFSFAGAVWTCSVLRKRFRVVRGAPVSPRANITSNPPSLGFPSSSPMDKDHNILQQSSQDAPRHADEPQDYFGSAGVNPTGMDSTASEKSTDINDVAHGLKISRLTQPADLPAAKSAQSPGIMRDSLLNSDHQVALSSSPSSRGSEPYSMFPSEQTGFFDWTRMADSPVLPPHIQFARNIDWASTSLGPIDGWSSELRSMCNLIMASPHPAAMYWGKDFVAIYNEAYIYLAGQKHPQLMGQSYKVAWAEIWDNVKDVFDIATRTGESTMKEDDCLFIDRAFTSGVLEEAWFDWSIIPLVGGDGSVVGLYNPAFEKTKRKVGERRTGTLSSIGEKTSTARDLKTFWRHVLSGLETNVYDIPFALLYSVSDEIDSDSQSSMQMGNAPPAKQCILEGNIGIPDDHPAAKPIVDLRDESDFLTKTFREAARGNRPLILSVDKKTLSPNFLDGIDLRGHPEPCSTAICCPVQSTRNETLGYLIIGVNPRRPYDDDYNIFIQMLGRQISTAMASVVLFEEEIRAGMKAKRRADIARLELSEQLAIQTQAAAETERKFTQMARFAPVGIFIADSRGVINYRNEKWYEILKAPKGGDSTYHWMDAIKDEDKDKVTRLWADLVHHGVPMNAEVRFKSSWVDQNGNQGDTWVLASGYPEKDEAGRLEQIYGSITDISQQKWAEHFEKRRMEEAVELKRQQENFIDITSHEMRNPLSAILQCADEIATSLTSFQSNGLPHSSTEHVTQGAVDAAGIITLCAQHQKRIVDDILTLSKLDSALLLVTPCDVMPRNVVQRALKMFDGEVQTADIGLDFKIDDSINDLKIEWVKMDPSRVLQVLINLTTNAIKFTTTQNRRVISVTLSASVTAPTKDRVVSYVPARSKRKDLTRSPEWGTGEDIFLHFAVKDTGRGLTEDEKKLLFLRFSQASPRTHVQYGGSGLGLFISRELVELQGGEIGVASVAGEGSTFAFYVKARRSAAPTNEMDDFPPSMGPRKSSSSNRLIPSSLKPAALKTLDKTASSNTAELQDSAEKESLKILIVEDNLVNQKVLARQLKNIGVLVHVANHGGECLDLLRESTFWRGYTAKNGKMPIEINAILMDQEMPVMDGLTCTKAIRELEAKGDIVSHIPIIAVTANARTEQIDVAMAAGMDGVVSKPFRIPDLIPKVESLVAKYPLP